MLKKIIASLFCLAFLLPGFALAGQVEALKVTVLSTMLADRGLGEWGYSALVEVDGYKYLFDTGANPDVVLKNAKTLGIDLSDVEDVLISHNHDDYTGGLIALRRDLMARNPRQWHWSSYHGGMTQRHVWSPSGAGPARGRATMHSCLSTPTLVIPLGSLP